MKQFINPRLGAALVLVLFTFAVVQLSSCGGDNPGDSPQITKQLAKQIILRVRDSGSNNGNSPGGTPKDIRKSITKIIVYCPTSDCSLLNLGAYTPAAGADSVDDGLEFQTTAPIPANTTIRLEIRILKDTTSRIYH